MILLKLTGPQSLTTLYYTLMDVSALDDVYYISTHSSNLQIHKQCIHDIHRCQKGCHYSMT